MLSSKTRSRTFSSPERKRRLAPLGLVLARLSAGGAPGPAGHTSCTSLLAKELAPFMTPIKSHCPYCALQCGMALGREGGATTVAGDEAFPVNEGALCIKGWTAGSLLSHPDRLTTPLIRGAGGRLVPASWEDALARAVRGIRATQAGGGRDAVGVLGSGSLTNEKAYLLGKFARVALRTPSIDYNGRFCMSSRGRGRHARVRDRPRPAVPGRRHRPRGGDPAGRRQPGGDDAAADALLPAAARGGRLPDRRRPATHRDRRRGAGCTCARRPGPTPRSRTACCTCWCATT